TEVISDLSFSDLNTIVDMTGRIVTIPDRIDKIISLVPSITEFLYDLGLEEKIVGKTIFCTRPENAKDISKVGGTKKVKFELINELQPDIIICNKEENTPEIVTSLEDKYPVWVSDINNSEDAYQMMRALGKILEVESKAEQWISLIQQNFKNRKIYRRFSCLYLIWKSPYMSVGSDTFIHHMLENAGFD